MAFYIYVDLMKFVKRNRFEMLNLYEYSQQLFIETIPIHTFFKKNLIEY